jgi:hypothetical protein
LAAVATRSQHDCQGQTPMTVTLSSKTESKGRESRSIQEIKQWARPQIELQGHGIRRPEPEQREA